MTKILVSIGFGAGWSTWNSFPSKEARKYFLTYKPLIDYIEKSTKKQESRRSKDAYPELEGGFGFNKGAKHPIIEQLEKDMKEKFGMDSCCFLGAGDLTVEEVNGPFRIDEYDGSESVELIGEIDYEDYTDD